MGTYELEKKLLDNIEKLKDEMASELYTSEADGKTKELVETLLIHTYYTFNELNKTLLEYFRSKEL